MIRITTVALALAALASLPVELAAQTPSLKNPASLKEQAPATYKVKFDTSVGVFVLQVNRDWAPLGADRFYNLVRSRFFDGQRISRIRPKFIAQWGLHWDAGVIAAWKQAYIRDDPPRTGNTKGTVAFAFKDPHTRATQVYVNLVDNAQLDAQGFAPFGRVTAGMDAVEKWYGEYGENAGGGLRAGTQGPIEREGAAWLDKNFPLLDRIISARIAPIR